MPRDEAHDPHRIGAEADRPESGAALLPERVRCRSCGRKIDAAATTCPGCAHPQLRLCACGQGVSVHVPMCECGRRFERRTRRAPHPTPGAVLAPAEPIGRWTLPLIVALVVAAAFVLVELVG